MSREFTENFVEEVVRAYGARDVFSIAEKAKVAVVYESWHPVTFGEFERKTNVIRVNRRALEAEDDSGGLERRIIAHELAHFFARDWHLPRAEEEAFAREFAEILTERK